ncbi:MAG: amidohydrolase family protein [Pirellulales bacterium]
MDGREAWTLRPRWFATTDGSWREQAALVIRAGRIAAIANGDEYSELPSLELPDAVVLPGLINAHTHLEFSGRTAPIAAPEGSFAQWIRTLVTERRERVQTMSPEAAAQQRAADTALGAAEAAASGVTTFGEIARPDWPLSTLDGPCDATVFLELLGLGEERIEPLLAAARQHLERARGASWQAGLSPHAPYTVHPRLAAAAAELSAASGAPVAMHLAESWDELELLASHSGPLVEVLSELQAWNPAALPRGLRPRDYLELLAAASHALVVHGNFLDAHDWDYLAQRRESMAVVYCPRTHASFLPGRYPLLEMLASGVRVVLGTDSRATNPDLDFLAELRWVAARFPELAPSQLLQMATVDAAIALGRDDEGRIAPGAVANLTIVRGAAAERDPWFWLTNAPDEADVVVRGRLHRHGGVRRLSRDLDD